MTNWRAVHEILIQIWCREIGADQGLIDIQDLIDDLPKREWVGLTKDEIIAIGKELGLKCRLGGNPNIDIDYAEAIETKLRELNT